MVENVLSKTGLPTLLRFRPLYAMTPEEFQEFCRQNPDMHAELSSQGEVIFMSPSGGKSSASNALITGALIRWALQDDQGVVFDSSGGFILPNGAVRSPDAAWVRRQRLAELAPEEHDRFLPLCPDFVIEVASPSDRLADLQAKMKEYVGNGAQLGWLIVPATRSVYVYRPGKAARHLTDSETIDASPILPGFMLALIPVWQPFS